MSQDEMHAREVTWSALMQSGNAGDRDAYHRLLQEIAPVLRATTDREMARMGMPPDRRESIVQQILLAVHLKRHTWDTSGSFCTWLFSITRTKLLDAMSVGGRRIPADIDSFAVPPPGPTGEEAPKVDDLDGHIKSLRQPQRRVLQAIASEGASVREAAAMLMMSENRALVALHRGLSMLANKMRRAGANRLT